VSVSRPSVRVRPAERADIAVLVTLITSVDIRSGVFSGRGILDPDIVHLRERLGEILDERERTLLIATDEQTGDAVGLLVAKMDEIGAIDLTPALHVTHLLVAPSHRRRGVGRALLAAAVHLADERGVDRILATAASGSREANRYLARLGFAPLVVHRVASTAALRRSLGISEVSERIALLRRARLARAQRGTTPARPRGLIGRGA
jgi:GNAT superfamily N-acetyltransferase